MTAERLGSAAQLYRELTAAMRRLKEGSADRSAQLLVLRGGGAGYMTSRKESGLIKGLLSSAVDTFLAPYGRFMEAHPRRSIMVGTCN